MTLSSKQSKVVNFLEKNGFITIKEIERLGVAAPHTVLRKLVKIGLITKSQLGIYILNI